MDAERAEDPADVVADRLGRDRQRLRDRLRRSAATEQIQYFVLARRQELGEDGGDSRLSVVRVEGDDAEDTDDRVSVVDSNGVEHSCVPPAVCRQQVPRLVRLGVWADDLPFE